MGAVPGDNGVREHVKCTDVGDESPSGVVGTGGGRENQWLEGGWREGVEEGLEEREQRRSDEEGDSQVTVVVGE